MRGPRLLLVALAGAWLASGVLLQGCGDRSGGPSEGDGDTGAVALRTWQGFFRVPRTDRIPSALASNPGTPWGDYVGSGACRDCHPKAYASWRDSFHSRTLYDARAETLFGDFSGNVRFDDPKYAFRVTPSTRNGRYYLKVERNPRATNPQDTYGEGVPPLPTGDYEVLYAFGNRRHQPYVVRAKDGRFWVPPVYWNDVTHGWEWDNWRPYVVACAMCHVTGIKSTDVKGLEADRLPLTFPDRYNLPPSQEGWAEGAVGCEMCHGPGRDHVEVVRRMGDEPYRAYLAAGGKPTIYNPDRDTPERRMQQCDQCHNFFTESSVTWRPRPTGYDRDANFRRIRPFGLRDKSQFYKDGTDMSPCTVGWVFRQSKMAHAGVECRTCHDSHGNEHWAELKRPTERNELCLHCHREDASGRYRDDAAVAAHSRHRLDGPGSLCVECHMPRNKHFSNGVHVMSQKLPAHSFSIPTGHEGDEGGPASACNLCHTDRSAAWTVATLARWATERKPPAPPAPAPPQGPK